MTIEQIRTFIETADAGSFSEAAERLFTTQSSISKHIQSLEKELQLPLFDRSRRQIRLTEAGEALLIHARELYSSYQNMLACAQSHTGSGGTLCTVRVASIPVMAQYGITDLMAEFLNAFPHINLEIQEIEGADAALALKNQEFDFAFTRTEQLDESYCVLPVFQDELCAVLPETHPLGLQESIALKELSGESFLLLNPRTQIYDLCIRSCQNAGFSPNIIYTGTRMENILELIGRSRGVSLMMLHAVSYARCSHIRILPLQERIASTVGLVRRKKRPLSEAGRIFWQFIQQRCP